MPCAPPRPQRALPVAIMGAKRRATPAPALADLAAQRAEPVPTRWASGPELRPVVDP